MAIKLEKGQRINLEKGSGAKLTNFCVGCNWGAITKKAFFGLTTTTVDVDLDLSCLLFDEKGEVVDHIWSPLYNLGKIGLPKGKLDSNDRALHHTGDDLTGGNSDGGDDETLNVDLAKVDPQVQEIIFTATIYKAEERKQNFGQVRNSYIRIYNSITNEEIARYDLDEDFSIETAVEFGRLYRRNGEWKFEAMGIGNKGGLQALVNKYQ